MGFRTPAPHYPNLCHIQEGSGCHCRGILQPPEALLAKLLDPALGGGPVGGRRGGRGFGQSGRRHVVLPIQGLHNALQPSLLLAEVVLHAGGREGRRHKAVLGGWAPVKFSERDTENKWGEKERR